MKERQVAESVAADYRLPMLREALADPTIFLVEETDHAENYWLRQAQRLIALLDSDNWARAEDDWIRGRTDG